MKYCKDCKWFKTYSSIFVTQADCNSPRRPTKEDPVWGMKEEGGAALAYRFDGCGREAIWFEPKEAQ